MHSISFGLKSFGEILKSLSDKDKWIFDKYMLLDYILLQEDRHYSNLAVVNNRLYPLFDNGECLGIGSIGYFWIFLLSPLR